MNRYLYAHAICGLIGVLSLSLWSCSDDPHSPEERVRQSIREAEDLIERRVLSKVMSHVHPNYLDQDGRDFQQLRIMLAGYFLRNQSIHIISRVKQIEIDADGKAQAVIYAGVAGGSQRPSDSLETWRSDLLQLQLTFVEDEGEGWLLSQASWERVRL
jgi:hypothetical protein